MSGYHAKFFVFVSSILLNKKKHLIAPVVERGADSLWVVRIRPTSPLFPPALCDTTLRVVCLRSHTAYRRVTSHTRHATSCHIWGGAPLQKHHVTLHVRHVHVTLQVRVTVVGTHNAEGYRSPLCTMQRSFQRNS